MVWGYREEKYILIFDCLVIPLSVQIYVVLYFQAVETRLNYGSQARIRIKNLCFTSITQLQQLCNAH